MGSFSYSFNGFTVKIPNGCFLTHTIKGSKRKITNQFAGVDCAGLAALPKFYNWRIDFAYADTNGKTYKTSRGKTHTTGDHNPLRHNAPQTLPKYGKACAKFYTNGKLRATQCHYITG
ncbi:hypothetical protein [Streptomyces sp. Da 82-17]|uniref:hypothetical protein n=1 Tax=Streptomyces sp. Da 82-17 TaxID=3377116 RepID=UPI0038D45101